MPYIVMTASEHMPSSVKAPYRKVAVIEVEGDERPKMISERAKGVKRVVSISRNLHARGVNTAFARAYAEAEALAAKLNAGGE